MLSVQEIANPAAGLRIPRAQPGVHRVAELDAQLPPGIELPGEPGLLRGKVRILPARETHQAGPVEEAGLANAAAGFGQERLDALRQRPGEDRRLHFRRRRRRALLFHVAIRCPQPRLDLLVEPLAQRVAVEGDTPNPCNLLPVCIHVPQVVYNDSMTDPAAFAAARHVGVDLRLELAGGRGKLSQPVKRNTAMQVPLELPDGQRGRGGVLLLAAGCPA